MNLCVNEIEVTKLVIELRLGLIRLSSLKAENEKI